MELSRSVADSFSLGTGLIRIFGATLKLLSICLQLEAQTNYAYVLGQPREIIINDAKINHSVVFWDLCPRDLFMRHSIMHYLECFIVLFQVADCYCPARNMHLFDIETSAVLKVGRRRAALCWDIVKRSKYCREKIYYKRYMHAGSAFIERLSICRRGEGENNNNAHAALALRWARF